MQILRPKEMTKRLGISKSTLYRMEKAGELPPRHRISKMAVGWLESDVEKWLKSKSEDDERHQPA